jgi:tetratricopeptide (TPR) repeat protein
MHRIVQNGLWLGAAMLLAIASVRPLAAQTSTPDTKNPSAQAAPAPNAPAAPAPDPFAFPEADSKTKSVGEDPAPDAPAPAAPTPNAPMPAAAPGDTSGYSSSSDGAAGNPEAGTLPDARQKLELHDEGSAGHIDTARADKDFQIADFYKKDGNYMGAYLRYKDAVTYDPDDADAHFRMAEMARKLNKTAEAIEQYSAALKLDPQGSDVKAARKALAELQPAAHQ